MAPEQQFCLRWNNYQSNLTQVFEQLLQCERFVDVTLACEGNSLKAHRVVLSACSSYFQTVLADSQCSHPVIILQEVKWSELKAIIEFMYKGEINVSQEQLASLLKVAESLKIRGLADVGEDGEAVLTSPTESPRVSSSFWSDDTPRKRRRISESGRSRSNSHTPSPRTQSPASAAEILEATTDAPINGRGSSTSNPSTSISLASASPVASLASSLSSLAHLQGPMPPPGPPLPPHLAHLPPLSPLSPLLNMHPMPRPPVQDDFEIRPGIAEMIREEERAKLFESTHQWIGNPMADSYQAQVQAAWQKSWNQTQSLLQNLRFRERGPLKSWRPETMADAIHAVLKEGLSLSQAARKYDIPYPTFVLYANRVHNLLGPSMEPGDMRPKGRGRPQRILLGSWPEDQIKGVIRAVVFRDTALLRDHNDHKENKHPATPAAAVKDEANANGSPSSSRTDSINPASGSGSRPSSNTNGALPPVSLLAHPKQEPGTDDHSDRCNESPAASIASNASTTPVTNASPPGVPTGPQTPQSRPSSTSSCGYPNTNGPSAPSSQSPSNTPKMNGNIGAPTGSPNSQISKSQRSPTGQYNQQSRLPSSQSNAQAGRGMSHIPTPQQLLGMMTGGVPGVPIPGSASHLPRLYGEVPTIAGRPGQGQINSFHPGYPRPGHPTMSQNMGLGTGMPTHMGTDEQDISPEALLFGKIGSERHTFGDSGGRPNISGQFEGTAEASPNTMERPMMYRDGLDSIKNEPEAIMN